MKFTHSVEHFGYHSTGIMYNLKDLNFTLCHLVQEQAKQKIVHPSSK